MVGDASKNKSVDPLPYIIIFAVLFFIALGVLTWALGAVYREHECAFYPNIWCSDDWSCNNVCPAGYPGNECFVTHGPGSTGLASCIFGPNAPGHDVCYNTPPGTGGVACGCPTGMTDQTNNCFSGCAFNFNDMNPDTLCCCCPGMAGCPYTRDNPPPPACNYKGSCRASGTT